MSLPVLRVVLALAVLVLPVGAWAASLDATVCGGCCCDTGPGDGAPPGSRMPCCVKVPPPETSLLVPARPVVERAAMLALVVAPAAAPLPCLRGGATLCRGPVPLDTGPPGACVPLRV